MTTSSDIDRWETAIQQIYEKRLLYYPSITPLGWRLLYSPRRVLGGARIAPPFPFRHHDARRQSRLRGRVVRRPWL